MTFPLFAATPASASPTLVHSNNNNDSEVEGMEDYSLEEKVHFWKCWKIGLLTSLEVPSLEWSQLHSVAEAATLACQETDKNCPSLIIDSANVSASFHETDDDGNCGCDSDASGDSLDAKDQVKLFSEVVADKKSSQVVQARLPAGRVLLLQLFPIKGIGINHIIKLVENNENPIELMQKIRTAFIQIDENGVIFIYIVHFAHGEATKSLKRYPKQFPIQDLSVVSEDIISFSSDSKWQVISPILIKNGKITWSKILPPDYVKNKGKVQFDLTRVASSGKVIMIK